MEEESSASPPKISESSVHCDLVRQNFFMYKNCHTVALMRRISHPLPVIGFSSFEKSFTEAFYVLAREGVVRG